MNIYSNLFLICLSLGIITLSEADPCNRNFGGCDRVNGLCWGTGENTHFCTCKAGYRRAKGRREHVCVDIDECAKPEGHVTPACDENAICENTPGSYKCTCTCGYMMDYTGQHCVDARKVTGQCILPTLCRHKDPILRNFLTTPFSTNAGKDYLNDFSTTQYVSAPQRARCDCESGFVKNACGFCVDLDECETNNPCKGRGARCVNTEGSFYCDCAPGYVVGPCRERCYRQGGKIPDLCEKPRLGVLNSQGFTFRTSQAPILIGNYKFCAEGVENNAETVEEHNLDNDNKPDVKLTWLCDGGSSVLIGYSEEEAVWESWSCWTACKATPWGGVQTRMRRCLHGLPSQGNCRGEGSQKRSCYSGKRKKFRIRKDARRLSDKEKKDLIQAFESYKADDSATGFHNAASSHGWPNQCENGPCCPHGAKMKFVTWHRSIMLHFEEGLNRYLKDKTIGIPYWNWLDTNRNPPSLGWDKRLYGKPNPWTNMTVLLDVNPRTPMRTIQRDDVIFTAALNFAHDYWLDVASKRKKPHILHEFAAALERGHGAPHVSVCGQGRRTQRCDISLGNLNFAAFDPLFLMHHCQVDRLWAVAQKEIAVEKDRGTTWTPQTGLEAMEERSDFSRPFEPFHNESLIPFPIVRATNTMRDSYYYEELTGVKYDNVDNNGYPSVRGRGLRKAGQELVFIGHYFQNTLVNFAVNYYDVTIFDPAFEPPCSRLNETERVGTAIKLGTPSHFQQRVPDLTLMEKIGRNAGGALDIEFRIKACYTEDQTCRERCPELRTPRILLQPSPMLVYYVPKQPVDIYKFEWSEGRRLPNWYINLHSGSQWVYFHGNRVDNIVQVRTARAYSSCDSKGGRAITCHSDNMNGAACMLPSGIYYLVDTNRRHCNNGLRMLIISRK